MMSDRTPELPGKLSEYGNKDVYPFHMPGHKRNVGTSSLKGSIFEGFYRADITEISGFDDLNAPCGIIKDAEERAQEAYGSEHTHYLVNGSTLGILTAVSAISDTISDTDKDNGVLLIGRNCHRSVYHAAFINRLPLSFIEPEYYKEYGIYGEVSLKSVEASIKNARTKNVKIYGIVVTSPTYEGIFSDIEEICRFAHSYGIPVIVDEAHGAHFGFGEGFPQSSVRLGADIVVHSVHKTLSAPTQTALIHVNGSLIKDEAVKKYLRIYQTSSPSYLLMAGIDQAISEIFVEGKDLLKKVSEMKSFIREETDKTGCFEVLPYGEDGKVVVFIKNGTVFREGCVNEGKKLTGRMLFDLLRDRYDIEMEMASVRYVLGILTIADRWEGIKRLTEALNDLSEQLSTEPSKEPVREDLPEIKIKHETKLPFYKAFGTEGKLTKIGVSSGMICADIICVYPPGIPLIIPGEVIGKDDIEIIRRYEENGFDVQGITDGMIRVLEA